MSRITNNSCISLAFINFLLLILILIRSKFLNAEPCNDQTIHEQSPADRFTRIHICAVAPNCINLSSYADAAISDFQVASHATKTVKKTLQIKYYEDCDRTLEIFGKCYEQFLANESSKLNTETYAGLILAGPWCDELPSSSRSARHLKFTANNKYNVMFLTTSLNVRAPSYIPNTRPSAIVPSTLTYPITVLLHGLANRYGELLYHTLTQHFLWKRFALVNLLQTQNSMENSHCDDTFMHVRSLAAKDGHVTTELYTYRPPATGEQTTEHVDNESKYMVELWRRLALVNRIIIICGSVERAIKMLEQSAQDAELKHGIIIMTGDFGHAKEFVDILKRRKLDNLLDVIKVLAIKPTPCHKLNISRSNVFDNRLNLDQLGYASEHQSLARIYFCSIAEAMEDLLSRTLDNLANPSGIHVFEPHRLEIPPVHELFTFNRSSGSYVRALEISWKFEGSIRVVPLLTPFSPIYWSRKEDLSNISDAPHMCGSHSTLYMCPLVGHKPIPFIVKILIAFVMIVFIILCIVGTIVCIHYRNRYRHLLFFRRWHLNAADLQDYSKGTRAKKMKPSKKFRLEDITMHKIPPGCMEIGVYPRFGAYKRKTKYVAYDILSTLQSKHLRDRSVLNDLNQLDRLFQTSRTLVELLGIDDSHAGFYSFVYSFDVGTLLAYLLRRVPIQMDLKYSLIRDLAMGLRYINTSFLQYHGDLRTDRCIVDERFVLRVVITRLPSIIALQRVHGAAGRRQLLTARLTGSLKIGGENPGLMWVAPELLRDLAACPTPASDVYSFGIIVHEITFQMGTFYKRDVHQKHNYKVPAAAAASLFKRSTMATSTLNPSPGRGTLIGSPQTPTSSGSVSVEDPFDLSCALEIVKARKKNKNLEPDVPTDGSGANYDMLNQLMRKCWNLEPIQRPTIAQICHNLQTYIDKNKIDVVFNVGKRLAKASKNVLAALNTQNKDSADQQRRAMKYIIHLMPNNLCYEFLTACEKTKTSHSNVTILFANLVNFHEITRKQSYMSLLQILDNLSKKYDNLLVFYDVMPMHRVGTSLMVCSGVPHENSSHASEIAQVAMQIRILVMQSQLVCKIGMHSGKVMSGLVGKNVPQYGICGDAVNTASRMATTTGEFEIQLSEAAKKALCAVSADFLLDSGKEKDVKGLGKMTVYTLKGHTKYKDMDNLPINVRIDGQEPFKRLSSMPRTDNEMRSELAGPSVMGAASKMVGGQSKIGFGKKRDSGKKQDSGKKRGSGKKRDSGKGKEQQIPNAGLKSVTRKSVKSKRPTQNDKSAKKLISIGKQRDRLSTSSKKPKAPSTVP